MGQEGIQTRSRLTDPRVFLALLDYYGFAYLEHASCVHPLRLAYDPRITMIHRRMWDPSLKCWGRARVYSNPQEFVSLEPDRVLWLSVGMDELLSPLVFVYHNITPRADIFEFVRKATVADSYAPLDTLTFCERE